MKLTSILIVTWMSAATAIAQSPRADFVLDLLTFQHAPASDAANPPTSGSGGGSSHRNPTPDPIRLTLLTLERTRYAWGDSIVYEVLVENIGRRPVTLPWSPDLIAADSVRPGRADDNRSGAVSLEVRRDGRPLPNARIAFQTLFGARTQPRTVQTLAPRQTALIRVPGYWEASAAEVASVMGQEQAATVQVTAVFDLFDEHLQVHSVNSIEVSVERRPTP
jgi:hypothetical protein